MKLKVTQGDTHNKQSTNTNSNEQTEGLLHTALLSGGTKNETGGWRVRSRVASPLVHTLTYLAHLNKQQEKKGGTTLS